ncbi:hypothetical protein SM96_04862 [Klebsiella pneumoniae]|nr:hypothetical protein SM96_04862 [Klebsiella pneumoniae]
MSSPLLIARTLDNALYLLPAMANGLHPKSWTPN